ncbi:MAG TPA: 4-alpha-glucanotransferase, partial [Rhodopila sp.]
ADLPPLVTAVAGRPTRLDLGGSDPLPAELLLESGDRRHIALAPSRGRLRVPAVAETGYHRLRVEQREIVLAVSPGRCRSIEDVVPDARLWGLAAQLYALNRPGDGGIGDLAGAADLARLAAEKGADAIALSPMHALYAADPTRYGPYSPSTRLFLNPLYAAPGLVLGSAPSTPAPPSSGLIDWPEAAAAKYASLRTLFDSFLQGDSWDGPLGADFARYRADGGILLRDHACFEALQTLHTSSRNWRDWPADLRDPRSTAVNHFIEAQPDEVLFHEFLQWVSDRSVAATQDIARQAGMRIGLIGDLAVGMDPNGSHAWSRQKDILDGLTIGAPPDLLNPQGQDWNLTGFSPRALEANGLDAFLTTLRATMRHVGGIRIDHVMSLARIWLIPDGASPADGAYLSFPTTDLLRLLALESTRRNVVVIGENLGTIPEGFAETLAQTGVHGMRVLWFERDPDAGFSATRGWNGADVAMTSTHDLPTVAGWWKGNDIDVRQGQECERQAREQDRPKLWDAFVRDQVAEGPVPAPEDTDQVVDAAVRFIAKTEMPLSLIPLEDLLGQLDQPNLPGNATDHPNWRRRLPAPADVVLKGETVARRIDFIAGERPRQ